jgi:hypothetical protein
MEYDINIDEILVYIDVNYDRWLIGKFIAWLVS